MKKKKKAVYKLTTDKFKMKIRNISGDEIIIDSSEIKKLLESSGFLSVEIRPDLNGKPRMVKGISGPRL